MTRNRSRLLPCTPTCRVSDDRGVTLIFAVFGLLALTVLGLGLVTLSLSAMNATANERDTARALAIADAGLAKNLRRFGLGLGVWGILIARLAEEVAKTFYFGWRVGRFGATSVSTRLMRAPS